MKPLVSALFFCFVLNQTIHSQYLRHSNVEKVLTIKVRNTNGEPFPYLTVVSIDHSTNAILKGTMIDGGSARRQTDAQGQLNLPAFDENIFLMAATDSGFGLAQTRDLTNNSIMQLMPWGRIEGIRLNFSQPMANQKLAIFIDGTCLGGTSNHLDRVNISSETVTDSKGRFTFVRVPPVGLRLCELRNHPKGVWEALEHLAVESGKTKNSIIATHGRTVVGRVSFNQQPLDISDKVLSEGRFYPVVAQHGVIPGLPAEYDTPSKRTKWWEDWYQSRAGRKIFLSADESGSRLEFLSNGAFIAEMIAPGRYWVSAEVRQNDRIIAKAHEVSILVPKPKAASENDAFDLGIIPLNPPVSVGNIAPDFNAKNLDGKSVKLSDFRGKYVLLDFWAVWCLPCVAETPNLKKTYDAYGKDGRFEMISLSLDENVEAPKKFVQNRKIGWKQIFLGDFQQDRVTKDFEVDAIPSIWLIDPTGKIISRNLRGSKIKEAVAAELNSK